MEAKNSEKAALTALAVLMVAGLLNYASGHLLGWPVVYCLTRFAHLVLNGLFYWLFLASLLAFIVSLFVAGMTRPTFIAIAFVFLSQLIPAWAGILFGLGMQCHG